MFQPGPQSSRAHTKLTETNSPNSGSATSHISPVNDSHSQAIASRIPASVSRVRERISLPPGCGAFVSGRCQRLSGSVQHRSRLVRAGAGVASASVWVGAHRSPARVSSALGRRVLSSGCCQSDSGLVQHGSGSLHVALRVGASRCPGRCMSGSGFVRAALGVGARRGLGRCEFAAGSLSGESCSASFYSVGAGFRLLFHVSPESKQSPNQALQACG